MFRLPPLLRVKLPKELQINATTPQIERMQLLSLIMRRDISINMREYLIVELRALDKRSPEDHTHLSIRVH